MPPLGEKLIELSQPTEEELAQEAEIHGIEQGLYGVMQALVPVSTPSFPERFFQIRKPDKSAVATYPLPGEPELRQMNAWVERDYDEGTNGSVSLCTQVVEKVDGRIVRKKSSRDRAWTNDGGLYGWKRDASRNLTHDEQLTVLNDIGDTLELIAEANRAGREQ
jgi:hypothetical protein